MTDDRAEILGLFERLDEMLAARDGAGAFALFAPDDDIAFFGSAADEAARGRAAVEALITLAAESPGTFVVRNEVVDVHVEGDTAWVIATWDRGDGDPRQLPYRTAAIFVRRAGAWRWHTHAGAEPAPDDR